MKVAAFYCAWRAAFRRSHNSMETAMRTKKLTIKTLPRPLLDEAREMLRGEATEVYVIRWNRRMRVVGKVFLLVGK